MSSFAPSSSQSKIRPSQIIGGIMGDFSEIGSELEFSPQSVVKEVTGAALEGVMDLFGDITGVEGKSEEKAGHFPSRGSIEFNKNEAKAQKELEDKKKAIKKQQFVQNLKDEQMRVQIAKDRMWMEEEINDITSNISTEEKNELLHYQSSYKDRSTYQKAELRKKIIEQRKKNEKQNKDASVAQTGGVSAMNAAMEGGSGTQGGGQSNLSAQATG
jgi:hypothetical protein